MRAVSRVADTLKWGGWGEPATTPPQPKVSGAKVSGATVSAPPLSWASAAGFAPALVLALGVFGLRLPTIDFDVLNVDEAVYHLMGAAWLDGTPPHLGIVDNKPLGLYFIHAVADGVFSDPIVGARILGAIATFIASWLLMRLARRFLGLGPAAGVLCGLLFSTYAILLGGDASQGPVFYAPLVVGGALLVMAEIAALSRGAAPSIARLAGAGVLLGLSLQIKYVTVFECAAFGITYLAAGWRAAASSAKIGPAVLAGAGVLVAGGLLPTALAYGAYAAMGHGAEFIFYTFTSNLSRAVTEDPLPVVASRMALIAVVFVPLVLLSLEHLRARKARENVVPQARENITPPAWVDAFLVVWFLAAVAGGVAQLQFCDHYFYEAVPPAAIMAAAALRPKSAALRARKAAVTGAVMVLGLGVVGYAALRLEAISHNGPPYEPSLIARDIGSTGARSMYVFNYHNLLYFLSGIPLPTRYPLASHLLRDLNADMFAFDARQEIARILGENPDVVVVDWPLSPMISADRREMVGRKLREDYCLWRSYLAGPHHVNVYLMKDAPLGAVAAACRQPYEPKEWVSASRSHSPRHPGARGRARL